MGSPAPRRQNSNARRKQNTRRRRLWNGAHIRRRDALLAVGELVLERDHSGVSIKSELTVVQFRHGAAEERIASGRTGNTLPLLSRKMPKI